MSQPPPNYPQYFNNQFPPSSYFSGAYQNQSQFPQPQQQNTHVMSYPHMVPPQPAKPSQSQTQAQPPQPIQQQQMSTKTQLKTLYDKLTIQNINPSLHTLCPQLQILQSLVKYENQIDQLIKRKRVELQESFIQPTIKIKQTMRIIVYINQIDSDICSLTIKGKILEEVDPKPFSNFFKTIEIKQDNNQYVWNHQPNQPNFETNGFELKKIPINSKVIVNIHPLFNPQKYKLHKSLASVLGLKEATRSQILTAFWEYVKFNNLQDKENKEFIFADENLRQLFGVERINMGQVNMHLKFLLDLPDPIRFEITAFDGNLHGIDYLIEQELPYQPELMPFLASKVVTDDNADKKTSRTEHPFMLLNQKVKGLEKQIQKLLEQLKSHKLKRDSYLQYSKDPALFLENILLQQNSYLEMMQNEDSIGSENPKNVKFLLKNQEIVERQIRRYLEQKDEQQKQ